MRRFVSIVCACLAAGTAGAAEPATDAVLAAVRALDAAIVAKDAAALGDLLVPDFVGAVPTGASYAKGEYIAFHTQPDEGLVAIEPAPSSEPAVRVFDGRFAVVNRRLAVRRRAPDGSIEAFGVQRSEALVLRDGRWRIASGQGTRVQPPPPR